MPFHILSLALLCGGLVTGAPTPPMSALPDSTSEEMIGWVSPDARRNTWGIIWSCLSIFIVCSWKCVHLNVPSHNESIAGWHTISKLPWSIEIPYWPQRLLWIKWRRKVLWMAFIAIAPEYGVALALAQYLAAKKDLTEANERLQNENRPKFTLAHAFYIQMGGVIVCDLAPRTPREEDEFTNTPWEYISRVEILTSLGQLCDSNLVPRFTEEDIRDLGKSDAFTKVFALLQCTWLVIQSIVRAAEGHAISQLELSTLAFIPCALAMYILWWQKPFGVERRRVLFRLPNAMDRLPDGFFFSLYDLLKADPEKRILDAKRKDTGSARVIDLLWFESPEEIDRDKYVARRTTADQARYRHLFRPLPRSASTTISTDSEEGDTSAIALTKKLMKTLSQKSLHEFVPSIVMYFTAVAFSAIHLAAWNWSFPSHLARELWRWFALTALSTSLAPIVLSGIVSLVHRLFSLTGKERIQMFIGISMMALLLFHTISRLVILGLTFYSLSSMPERAYEKVGWMAWFPHFS